MEASEEKHYRQCEGLCKGPETDVCPECLKYSKEARAVAIE